MTQANVNALAAKAKVTLDATDVSSLVTAASKGFDAFVIAFRALPTGSHEKLVAAAEP